MPSLRDHWYRRVDQLLSRRMVGARDPRIAAMGAEERLQRLDALRGWWADPARLPFPGGFLAAAPPAAVRATPARGGAVLTWASGYEPAVPEVREAYLRSTANATARARWFGDPARPGPVVLAVHGYRGGGRFEPVLWPIRRWRAQGAHVALPSLPFHGARAGREAGRPSFPAADPRFTNEGFRQAVWDLTALLGDLRRRGFGPIHLAGMSLGGYTAALLATLDDDLASLLLVVPLASLATFAFQHGRFGDGPRADALRQALEQVYRPTSPLSRPPRVRPERVRVVGTRSDRITGPEHTALLSAHFGVAPIEVAGSHVLQHRLPWDALALLPR